MSNVGFQVVCCCLRAVVEVVAHICRGIARCHSVAFALLRRGIA